MEKCNCTINLAAGLVLFTASLMLIAPVAVPAQAVVVPSGAGTSESPYLISEIGHLVWMSDNAGSSSGKYYTMTADIDASATAEWNDNGTDTSILEGFKPIGTYSYPDTTSFRGIFDGAGHTISGLVILRSAANDIGLFGYIGPSGGVGNLGLIGGAVTGHSSVGGLAGGNDDSGTVSNCYVTGAVTGTGSYVGGLVGGDNEGTVSNCHATGTVTATGSSTKSIGGLVGSNLGTVSNSYATCAVKGTGSGFVGGLVGENWYGTVSNCYSTGAVTAESYVGGLIGNSYASTVSNCYSTGLVTGSVPAGGLIGFKISGTVSSSYWNTQTSGKTSSSGGTGKDTTQMKQQATFTGWDFTSVWGIVEGMTYPFLPVATIAGDVNGDFSVNTSDLELVLGSLDKSSGEIGYSTQTDLDHDGTITSTDLSIVLTNME
ncbi:MAG: GLUG motif-containing protein [Phycisphaerae bacterium]